MQLSLRTSVISAVGFMGLLGLLFALFTGELFRHLTIENQRSAIKTLVQHETLTALNHLQTIGKDFNVSFTNEKLFQDALRSGVPEEMVKALNDQFFQYFITARVLSVAQLYILGKEYELIAASTQGNVELPTPFKICPRIIDNAQNRSGLMRIKVLYEFCQYQGKGYYAMMFPYGGLIPKGYFFVLADPATTLIKAETALGMPLSIRHPNGEIAQRSANWPVSATDSDLLIEGFEFSTADGRPALRVDAASDITSLNENLSQWRLIILAIVAFTSLVAALVAQGLLNKTLLVPIQTLNSKLRLIKTNREYLGQELKLSGNHELQELTESFNVLTKELKTSYKKLENMAFTDSLTSLPNRSLLQEALNFHTASNRLKGVPFAFFMMDMDRFKAINDTLGHQAGDIVLQHVSKRLEKALRKTDTITRIDTSDLMRMEHETIARLGGDEFAAVLPGVGTRAEATIVAEKIMNEMAAVIELDGYSISANLSIGIAICPDQGTDSNMLMRCADIAMYQAKQNQAGYAFYDSTQDTHNIEILTLESELQKAIECDDQLVMHFQPILSLEKSQVIGMECLVYWQHPTRGLLSPSEFIPLSEETGLIVSLTSWILHRTAQQCARFVVNGVPIKLSVNISARSLQNDVLLGQLDQVLKMYQVYPGQIWLELTETSVMTDFKRSVDILSKLDQRGVGLSLDDFGAGYTSLQYLKALPIDDVKIDRTFVVDMSTDRNNTAIVHAIIDLAHNLGLKVVAEGVETPEVLQQLRSLGCDYAQGYFIAKPMAEEKAIEWLKQNWRHV